MNTLRPHSSLLCALITLFILPVSAFAMGSGGNGKCVSGYAQIAASSAGTTQTFACPAAHPNLGYTQCASTNGMEHNPSPGSTNATCHTAVTKNSDGTEAYAATCYKDAFDTSPTVSCTVDYDCCE